MAPSKKPKPSGKPPGKKVKAKASPRVYTRTWHSCRPCDVDLCAKCFKDGKGHAHPLVVNKTGSLSPALELLRSCDMCGGNNLGGVTCSDGCRLPKRATGKVFKPVKRKPGVKKPIIYLYPAAPCEATVSLSLAARGATLTTLLPAPHALAPRAATWRVSVQPDGTLQPTGGGPPVASLFWEASGVAAAAQPLLPARSAARDTFCVAGSQAGQWLLSAGAAWGLSPREYTEFASFWAPLMAEHAFVALRLVPQQQWEALAPLTVAGMPAQAPTRTLRVFIAWRGVPAFAPSLHQGTLPLAPPSRAREENLVVEWGGQEC